MSFDIILNNEKKTIEKKVKLLDLTNDFLPILRAFLKSLRINLISNIPRTKTTKAIAKDAIYGNFGSAVVPVPNQKSYS